MATAIVALATNAITPTSIHVETRCAYCCDSSMAATSVAVPTSPYNHAFYRGRCDTPACEFPVCTASFFQLYEFPPFKCICCILRTELDRELHTAWLMPECDVPVRFTTRLWNALKVYRQVRSGLDPRDGAHPEYIDERHERATMFYTRLKERLATFYERQLAHRNVIESVMFGGLFYIYREGPHTRIEGRDTPCMEMRPCVQLVLDDGSVQQIEGSSKDFEWLFGYHFI
jgi:hypothetical protein